MPTLVPGPGTHGRPPSPLPRKQPMSNPVITVCVVGSPRWLYVGLEAKHSDDRVDVIHPLIHSFPFPFHLRLPTTFPANTAPPQHNNPTPTDPTH
jgi:hypothetical protein